MLHYLTSDIRRLFGTPHKGNLEEGILFSNKSFRDYSMDTSNGNIFE